MTPANGRWLSSDNDPDDINVEVWMVGDQYEMRQDRTAPGATRHGQPWEYRELQELRSCVDFDDLERFAVRVKRTFGAVSHRHRQLRPVLPGD